MTDWKEFIKYFKDFFDTLAGKLTAILAFALLVILALGWFGASIPAEYRALVYVVVIGAMLIFAWQAQSKVSEKRREARQESPAPPVAAGKPSQTETPAPPVQPAPKQACLQNYLEAVIADSRPLRLVGLDERAGDPTTVRLSLEDIYVALNTRTTVAEKGAKKKSSREEEHLTSGGEEKSRPLSALEALAQAPERRMVLLGFPGTGKSTFVRFLALRMAQELLEGKRKLENWPGKAILPVAISLGRFAESLPKGVKQGTATMVENFLKATQNDDPRCEDFAAHILDVLAGEGALLLFDGLDEVADLSLRPVVVQAVEAFSEKYARHPDSRFLVTCRTYSYQDPRWQLTKWPVHELALLNPKQIEQFVRAWYDQHTLLDQSRANEYAEKRAKLLEALRPGDRRRLDEIAPFPIILTIMAIVHASYELPDSRAQVYMQCVELLLEKWQTKRSIQGRTETRSLLADLGIPAARLYQALYEIAYEAHRGREKGKDEAGSLVTEKLVAGVMQEHLQDEARLKTFLDYCQSANGLLMLQGTVTFAGADPGAPARRVYAFPHLTFEEYLAGRHLEMLGAEHVRGLLDEAHDRWREVVKLLAEYLCFERSDRDRMNGLLEALSVPFPQKPADNDWRAAWLAGELLLLYRRAIPKPSPWQADVLNNLRRLVMETALQPRERAEAADILDQFWQPEDLYTFVPITQSPNQPTWLAKYPVTNAQYARFLESPDFAKKEFWLNFPRFDEQGQAMPENWGDAGWKWLKENQDKAGKYRPPYWNNPEFGRTRPCAPVVTITWYEANAYCKWLSANWQSQPEAQSLSSFIPSTGLRAGLQPSAFAFRLPTEPEWIMAAGGAENERYAWGALKDTNDLPHYANTRESGIGRTTPVWMYPQGASPCGALDMSGNVWEWQANYRDEKGGWLALRGGSWRYNGGYARVASGHLFDPHFRLSYVGFRVLVSSPPS